MLRLRILAIVGLTLEIVYFSLTSIDLFSGMAWDAIFILINALQVARLMRDRHILRLPASEKAAVAEGPFGP